MRIIVCGRRRFFAEPPLRYALHPAPVDERYGAIFALLPEQLDEVLLLSKFLPVTYLKLLPFGRIVTEPLAEFAARRHVFQPQIYRRASFVKPRGQSRSTKIRTPSFRDGFS